MSRDIVYVFTGADTMPLSAIEKVTHNARMYTIGINTPVTKGSVENHEKETPYLILNPSEVSDYSLSGVVAEVHRYIADTDMESTYDEHWGVCINQEHSMCQNSTLECESVEVYFHLIEANGYEVEVFYVS